VGTLDVARPRVGEASVLCGVNGPGVDLCLSINGVSKVQTRRLVVTTRVRIRAVATAEIHPRAAVRAPGGGAWSGGVLGDGVGLRSDGLLGSGILGSGILASGVLGSGVLGGRSGWVTLTFRRVSAGCGQTRHHAYYTSADTDLTSLPLHSDSIPP